MMLYFPNFSCLLIKNIHPSSSPIRIYHLRFDRSIRAHVCNFDLYPFMNKTIYYHAYPKGQKMPAFRINRLGHMPRRVDHVDGVVVAVGVEVLRPRDGGGAGIGILREEPGGGGVVVPGVHVEQAGGIRNAPRERHLVEERIARDRRYAVPPVGRRMRLLTGAGIPFMLFVMQLSRCRQPPRYRLSSERQWPACAVICLPSCADR